jgi:hypothetical protein
MRERGRRGGDVRRSRFNSVSRVIHEHHGPI